MIKNRYDINKSYIKNHPWLPHYANARTRCTNPKSPSYYYYGNKKILFKMTTEDFKELWFRDKAFLMGKPSIDRKDNDGHYTKNNCRFIELSKNISRAKKDKPCFSSMRKLTDNQVKNIRQLYYSENHTQTELSKIFNVYSTTICRIVHYKRRKYIK